MGKRFTSGLCLAVGMTALMTGGSAIAEGAGSYLAARHANIVSDFTEASRYYAKAMASAPENVTLLDAAIIAHICKGDVAGAAKLAARLEAVGHSNAIVDLVTMAADMAEGSFERAITREIAEEGLSPLMDGLIRGWAFLGEGRMSDAVAAFEEVAEISDFATFAYYHEALALALVGDFETAEEIMSGAKYGPLSISTRGVEAHAQILIQLERVADATALIDATLQRGFNAELAALRSRIDSGEDIAFDFVTSARQGTAEVLFNMAAILNGRISPNTVLIYARLAQHLRPDHVPALVIIAQVLEELGQYELATQAYGEVSSDHPAFFVAEMGRADALYADDRKDAAVEVLTALSKSHWDISMVHAALGDMLSRIRKDDEAIATYTTALDLRASGDQTAWPVYYARGIVHERQKNLAEMEADFRKALELSPDQPDVLNYLGYSLVEQRVKLDEALSMIKTAVARRPDSGYIADSLGWVFYRLGRYEEAVEPMERAVSLLPVDPIVNDHLGDVYWMVGRKREAEFQWKRALSFDPEEKEEVRIRRKLDVGLDVVLDQEARGETTLSAND
ncbi:MAG: tetratricopeptide repeat protein [Paracoccaceae bacterium]